MSLVVCRCVHLMKLVPKYVFIQLNMRYKFINPALSRMECGSSDFFFFFWLCLEIMSISSFFFMSLVASREVRMALS